MRYVLFTIALLFASSAGSYPVYSTMHDNNYYYVSPINFNSIPTVAELLSREVEVYPLPANIVIPEYVFDRLELFSLLPPRDIGIFFWAPYVVNYDFYIVYPGSPILSTPTVVPEPTTWLLFALGVLLITYYVKYTRR